MSNIPDLDFHDADLFSQKVEELLTELQKANPTWSKEELSVVAHDMAERLFFPPQETERPN